MDRNDQFGQEDQSDQRLSQEAQKFEAMMRGDEHHFFDVFELEDILHYYLRHNKLNKALKLVNFGLKKHPHSEDLYYKRAQVLIELTKYKEAERDIRRAVEMNPLQMEYVFLLSETLAHLGDYKEGRRVLENFMHLTERKEEVWQQIGTISELAGFVEMAEEAFRKAIALNPEYEEPVFELAFCLEAQERLYDAIDLYKEYLDRKPFAYQIWYNLGILYTRLGLFEHAVDAYDYALAIEDSFASAWFNKGNVLVDLERFEEALQCFLEASVHEKPDAALLYHIGECMEQLLDFAGAARYFLKATDKNPEYVEAWLGLAYAMEVLQHYSESLHYYDKGLKLDPDHYEGWVAYASCAYRAGHPTTAWEALQNALRINNSDERLWREWADMLHRDQNTDGAITFLEEGLSALPSSADLHFLLAAYQFEQKRWSKGMTALENGLIIDPAKQYLLFNIRPDLKQVPAVQALISQYSNDGF